MKTMRAAVLTKPGHIELHDAPLPEPGVGQVRVRLQGCGVCASNLEPWAGRPWFTYPMSAGALGHEGWGTVDAVGAGVSALREGDAVTLLSQQAYAEYDVADQSAVVPLPAQLAKQRFPGEPLGCAVNIFERSDISPGDDVAIVGVGFLGALLTRMASQCGARVIAISRRGSALEFATQMGAAHVLPMADDAAIIEEVTRLTGGNLCRVVIEATGKPAPLELAAQLTQTRGRLVIAGYHQDGTRKVNMQLWNWRGLDVINAHERDPAIYTRGIKRAVALAQQGAINPAPLLTHEVSLAQLGDALDMTRDRPDGFLKASVTI